MAETITIRLFNGPMDRLKEKAALEASTRLGNRVLNNARQRVNVDTGRLRSSGRMDVTGGANPSVRVGFYTKYAKAVHDGSRPHMIYPRAGGLLAWNGPSGVVFARMVRHPGYRGNPYLRDALAEETARF